MKRLLLFIFLLAGVAHAQLTVSSFSPANNSTNVPISDTLAITFSAALDTTVQLGPDQGILTNVGGEGKVYYSADLTTLYVPVTLSPNTVYFVLIYWAKAQGGAILQTPLITYFTTGSSFPSNSVAGSISSGATGVSPAGAVVALSSTPLSQDSVAFVSAAIANGSGQYVIPFVANGTFFPVCAKDANGDGRIDPSNGFDVVGFADSIIVSGASLSGVNMTFMKMLPITFSDAVHLADSLALLLPSNKTLRSVQGYEVDSIGRSSGWQFIYLTNGSYSGYQIEIDVMKRSSQALDSSQAWWVSQRRPFSADTAADSHTFLTNVEAAGGYAFRTQVPPAGTTFSAHTDLGDLRYSNYWQLIADQEKLYWGAEYVFSTDPRNTYGTTVKSMLFLGDFSTGAVVTSMTTDVKKTAESMEPVQFELLPNYPNPFNPSTTITFRITTQDVVTLKVFDVLGREIATLAQGTFRPGQYSLQWDAHNQPSGVYYCRLESGGRSTSTKLLLLK